MKRKTDTDFRFKRFTVRHDSSTMKVGTDAVLLGAWTEVKPAQRILEIGTGSGVIALMLAQRSDDSIKIDAIEMHADSVTQAKENIQRSPWPEKINVHCTRLQFWQPQQKYDLIVSNPPYFSNSLLPSEAIRGNARHSISLPPSELITFSKSLLNADGRIALVLPFKEGLEIIDEAKRHQLHLTKKVAVFSRHGKPQERWLLEFSKREYPTSVSNLILLTEGNHRSEDYTQLTSDFYLNP
jgi:tRNA1Val (adenine37-N6)-methyltransferase